jgi:hypothetical protein
MTFWDFFWVYLITLYVGVSFYDLLKSSLGWDKPPVKGKTKVKGEVKSKSVEKVSQQKDNQEKVGSQVQQNKNNENNYEKNKTEGSENTVENSEVDVVDVLSSALQEKFKAASTPFNAPDDKPIDILEELWATSVLDFTYALKIFFLWLVVAFIFAITDMALVYKGLMVKAKLAKTTMREHSRSLELKQERLLKRYENVFQNSENRFFKKIDGAIVYFSLRRIQTLWETLVTLQIMLAILLTFIFVRFIFKVILIFGLTLFTCLFWFYFGLFEDMKFKRFKTWKRKVFAYFFWFLGFFLFLFWAVMGVRFLSALCISIISWFRILFGF